MVNSIVSTLHYWICLFSKITSLHVSKKVKHMRIILLFVKCCAFFSILKLYFAQKLENSTHLFTRLFIDIVINAIGLSFISAEVLLCVFVAIIFHRGLVG